MLAVLYSHDAARDEFFLVHVRWGGVTRCNFESTIVDLRTLNRPGRGRCARGQQAVWRKGR
jgi:hypothetical protein